MNKMALSDRTAEQIEADENLTRAIEQCVNAYGFADDYIITDYMVIAAQVRLDVDGDSETAYSYLYRDSDMPYHRILGLLEVARTRAKFNMNKE